MYHRVLQTCSSLRFNRTNAFRHFLSSSSAGRRPQHHTASQLADYRVPPSALLLRSTTTTTPIHIRGIATAHLPHRSSNAITTTTTGLDPLAVPSTPPTPTTLAQYLDLLRADVHKMRRVHGATLTAALEHARFSAAGTDGSDADTLFLLQCCSMLPEKPRPEKLALIELAWSLVLRHAATHTDAAAEAAAAAASNRDTLPQPTAEQLIALLREYRTNMKKLNHAEFLERYAPAVRAGGARVYEALLYVAAEVGDEPAMVRILQAIRELPGGAVPSADVFNALILGHSRCHQLLKCEQVVDAMLHAGVAPTGRTYKELMRAYIENGEPERAEALLAERGAELSVPQVYSVVRTAIRRDDQSQVS